MVSDEELVQAMAAGDQAAFEAFVHRYHGSILGYLERMLRDPCKAEDLTQETFIRLIRQLRKQKVPDQIKPWMFRVATNLCKDYWKSIAYRNEQQTMAELPEKADEQATIFEIYERQETRKEIIETLNHVSEVQKEIILLRFFQDMKLQDIADTLEMTLSAVKTNLYNGLRRLKQRLDHRSTSDHSKKEGARHA